MKRTFQLAAILLCVALTASGCDFFRRLAGRPDAAAIARKAEAIQVHEAALEAARAAREDSLARVRQHRADSVAVMDSLRLEKARILPASRVGGLAPGSLAARYSIILGAFSVQDNAVRFGQRLSENGFPAEVIPFRNGYHAVGVCSTDDVVEMYRSLQRLKRQAFCPKNVWILTNE